MPRGTAEEIDSLLNASERANAFAVPQTAQLRQRMSRLVAQGKLVSPAPGIFVRKQRWESLKPRARHLALLRSLAQKHPDWVFCGPSAAVVHGLAVSHSQLKQVHVARTGKAGHRETALVDWRYVRAVAPEVALGLRVTPIVDTVADCLRTSSLRDGLPVADSLLRNMGGDATWLAEKMDALCARRRGRGQAVATATLADGRAENGGESLARAIMYELGYRMPDLQVVITNTFDGTRPRVDFYWELDGGLKVAGELDGREKYQNPAMLAGRSTVDALSDERLRESRITRDTHVMRFSYKDMCNEARFARLLDYYRIPRDGLGWPLPTR